MNSDYNNGYSYINQNDDATQESSQNGSGVTSGSESGSQQEMMNMFLAGDVSSSLNTNDTAVDGQNNSEFFPQHKAHNSINSSSNISNHKKTQSMNNVQDIMASRVSPKPLSNHANVRPGLKSYKSAMSMTSLTSIANESAANNKILPKTCFNSPFFIAVPTPKGTNSTVEVYNKQGKNFNSTITTTTTVKNPLNVHLSSHALPSLGSDGDKSVYGSYVDENTTLTTTSLSNEYPTTIIVDRFIKWKRILKALISYYREISMAQEQFARINNNIKANMKFGTILPNVLDNGTIVGGETSTTTATTTTAMPSKSNGEHLGANASSQDDFSFPARPKLGNRTTSTSSANSNQSDDEYVNNSPSSITTTTINTGDYLPFGSGSIQDLQVILKKHHIALAKKQYEASKELESKIIPKLEDLKKDLTFKIKEIKSLHDDFKTNIKEHVAITGQLLQKFTLSLEFIENNNNSNVNLFDLMDPSKKNLKSKNDPYLLKLQLDLQLKRQLLEEHYLQDSYTNLQKNGLELEKIIYLNVQKSLSKYSNLIDSQVRVTLQTLCGDLNQGILNKPPAIEWDNFVVNHPTSLLNWKSNDPFPIYRKLTDIKYPHMKSALAKCVRAGYLLKKNKLKKYVRSYFILTSNYMHEFKSSDFFKSNSSNSDDAIVNKNAKSLLTPIMSINLNHAYLAESSDENMVIRMRKDAVGMIEEQPSEYTGTAYLDTNKNHSSLDYSHSSAKSVSKKLGKLWKKPHSSDISNKLHSINSSSTLDIPRAESPTTTTYNSYSDTSFSFRYDSSGELSEQESKLLFKKWLQDINQLCSYETSKDRAKYIHEKVVNLKLEHAQRNNLLKSKSSNASGTALKAANSGKGSQRLEKPSHIEMPSKSKKFTPPNSHGSVVMTPSIDEHGNLVTVNEPRTSNHDSSINLNADNIPPTASDAQSKNFMNSNNLASSPGGNSLGKMSNDSFKLVSSPQENLLNGGKISSNDSSPLGQMAPSSNYNSTGGGYFAIPIKKTTSNPTITSKSKTVQSPASMARQVMSKPHSPQPQKPNLVQSSSTNSLNTLKKGVSASGNPLLSHKRISSLTSLSSLTNKVSGKAPKLSQMPEESDLESASDGNNSKVDMNKSLYS